MNSPGYYSEFPEHRLKVTEAGDRRHSPEAPGASGQGAGAARRGSFGGGAFCASPSVGAAPRVGRQRAPETVSWPTAAAGPGWRGDVTSGWRGDVTWGLRDWDGAGMCGDGEGATGQGVC